MIAPTVLDGPVLDAQLADLTHELEAAAPAEMPQRLGITI